MSIALYYGLRRRIRSILSVAYTADKIATTAVGLSATRGEDVLSGAMATHRDIWLRISPAIWHYAMLIGLHDTCQLECRCKLTRTSPLALIQMRFCSKVALRISESRLIHRRRTRLHVVQRRQDTANPLN